jgi:hypothetical protein
MKCLNCGREINNSATFCPFCGKTTKESMDKQSGNSVDNNIQQIEGIDEKKLVPSIVLSIISLIMLFISSGLGVLTSIAGIIFGIIGIKKPDKKKWSKRGMIISSCLTVICIFVTFMKLGRSVPARDYQQVQDANTSITEMNANSETQDNNVEPTGDHNNDIEENIFQDETTSTSTETTIQNDGDDFTILVYMIGSNLESQQDGGGAATEDIQEMMNASFKDNVNVVVQTGGANEWKNNQISADKICRLEVSQNGIMTIDELPLVSMCNTDTLSDFINWGILNYPASRYGLVLWDHGSGVLGGYGYDEHYPNDLFLIPDIALAIKNTGVHFDFVGFDACLMGSIESGYALKDCADYLIASEEIEAGIGWYYTDWLSYIGNNPSDSMENIGRSIVDGLVSTNESNAYWGKESNKTATLSLIDLSKIENAYLAWKDYLNLLLDSLQNGGYAKQSTARSNSRCYGDIPEENSYFDMVDMLDFINENALPNTFDIEQAIRDCIIYTNSNISGSNGLSVYIPYNLPEYLQSIAIPELQEIGFTNDYFDYFNSFCAKLEAGNTDVTEGDIPQLLQFTDEGNQLSIQFSDAQVNNISKILKEVGTIFDINDDKGNSRIQILSNGIDSDNDIAITNGKLIDNHKINSYLIFDTDDYVTPYVYTYDEGTYADGTLYKRRVIPATLNGTEEINILIEYYFVDNNDPQYNVMGYYYANGAGDQSKTLSEFQKGDVISMHPYFYWLDDDKPDTLYKEDRIAWTITIDDALSTQYIPWDAEAQQSSDYDNAYRYIIVDTYNNWHYTEWIRY